MAWDIPTPTQIADQASTDLEEGLRAVTDARGIVAVDARSERSVLRVLAKVVGLALYPVYLYFGWVVDQLFPDRCSETWLSVHARIWGVERIAATRAGGSVTVTGAAGTTIAAGTRLTLSGAVWATTAAVTIDETGSASLPVEAVSAGASGNRTADTELAFESPVLGLAAQVATVEADGVTGGADLEDLEVWRGRLIERIRRPPCGGADYDYEGWARTGGAARVTVHRAWIGAGTVGIAVAMPDGAGGLRTPTTSEVAALQARIDAARPVTATAIVLPATPTWIDVSAEISPYSVAVKTAVSAAIVAWLRSSDAQIGGTLHLSRLRERLGRAAGEDWHRLVAPAGETITLGPTSFPVLRNIIVTEAT